MRSAGSPRSGPAGASQAQRTPPSDADPLLGAVRAAVRAELLDLVAEGGHVRLALRSELEAALGSGCSPLRARSRRTSVPEELSPLHDSEGRAFGVSKTPSDLHSDYGPRVTHRTSTIDHFADVVEYAQRISIGEDAFAVSMDVPFARTAEALWRWLDGLEEPPRTGCLARLVTGRAFEVVVNLVIFLNCAFMVYAANEQIRSPSEEAASVLVGDWLFLGFYAAEMVLKLVVHGHWLFCNASWRVNIFDMALVVIGLVNLVVGARSGNFVRVLRLLKFGRAIRAIRVMSHMKHLRALIVCLQGSISSLFWSLVMLFAVYAVFALFLIQVITSHLQDTGEALEETAFYDFFPSFEASVLTLYRASTGGDDWSVAYQVIEPTGEIGSAIYLLFIAFVHFALINIITGIFVESAMKTLSPDSETLAYEHSLQEQENAKKLKQLCDAVDTDRTGMLTREKFEDGLRRKHIPLLLKMLGLQRHHVHEFFNYMAEGAGEDGQVKITKFVQGCMLLKGAATNFDLQKLHADFKAMQARHDQDKNEILCLLRHRLEA